MSMNETQRLYDSYAQTHFTHTTVMRESSYEDMARFFRYNYLPHLPRDRSAAIVDIGCGAGHFLYFLRSEGYSNVYGIDVSPEMISLCRNTGIFNVEQSDVFDFLMRHPKSFRAIVCNDLIEHIPRVRMLDFIEFVKAAMDEGTFLIKTINAASLFGAREVFIDFTHEVGFTPESLAQVLRLGGFDSITIQPLRMTPTNVKGRLLRFVGERVIQSLLKGVIMTLEGRGSRQPMVLTPTMLGIATVDSQLKQKGKLRT
jgi:2-polyprenyl-3-methyl-5-hydroxy-6-metoxy-1,4-benzoquinol methylase